MRLLLIGFGTVAQGLSELLIEKREELVRAHGLDWTVVGICDLLKGSAVAPAGLDLAEALSRVKKGGSLTGMGDAVQAPDAEAIIAQTEADVLVEATYTDLKTAEPATGYIRAAMQRGIHVVTTNKGPLALFGAELQQLAAANGVKLLGEGTVMAGTPLLNLIREGLVGSEVREMRGILNGTTNFILTEMEAGLAYAAALHKAQELGYAEAQPDADVLGHDALAKVVILANTVFGAALHPDDVPCQGITQITADDIAEATKDGSRYKLIGRVWRDGGQVKAEVAPQRVDLSHPLAGVAGAVNAMTVTTDTLGAVTIVGPGAGRRETGYALLNDLLHLAGHC